MKNSTDSPKQKQALQSQAQQLLPLLTNALSALNYQKIIHQRISQQHGNFIDYQGLTCAEHTQLDQVMIKWQLSLNNEQGLMTLNHEIAALNAIDTWQKNNHNIKPVILPLLDCRTMGLKVLQQDQRLTILVMPYCFNNSLAHYLKKMLTDSQKHQCIIQAAHLIVNLHKSGWLHNDIKPSNILLDNFALNKFDNNADNHKTNENSPIPSLLLTDFALATRIDDVSDFNQERVINPTGTPAYLAPESWHGQAATQQSDIYAFGIMIYEILTGTRPFKVSKQSNKPMLDWATQHCQQPIPALPKEYQRYQFVVNRVLAKRIEKRYQSMNEVLKDLQILKNS